MSMKITFWPHHKTLTMDFTLAALSSVVTYNNQLNGWPSAVDCNDDYNDGGNGDSDGNGNGEGDGDDEGNGGGTRCNKYNNQLNGGPSRPPAVDCDDDDNDDNTGNSDGNGNSKGD